METAPEIKSAMEERISELDDQIAKLDFLKAERNQLTAALKALTAYAPKPKPTRKARADKGVVKARKGAKVEGWELAQAARAAATIGELEALAEGAAKKKEVAGGKPSF